MGEVNASRMSTYAYLCTWWHLNLKSVYRPCSAETHTVYMSMARSKNGKKETLGKGRENL